MSRNTERTIICLRVKIICEDIWMFIIICHLEHQECITINDLVGIDWQLMSYQVKIIENSATLM